MLLTSPLSSPLKNPVRDVFSPAGSSQSLTAQVQALFAAGKVGGMWDFGDISTLFQDTAGATPVTAVTQPIGRVNDKSGLGNNATQPTAGARPLFSARNNLLTKSEQFNDGVWVNSLIAVNTDNATAPDGAGTAEKLCPTAVSGAHVMVQNAFTLGTGVAVLSVYAKSAEYTRVGLRESATTGAWAVFDLSGGTVLGSGGGTSSTSIASVGNGWYRCSMTVSAASAGIAVHVVSAGWASGSPNGHAYTGNGTDGIYAWGAQLEQVALSRYQRVNTASDYDTVGFPAFAQFDGVNDLLQVSGINLSATNKVLIGLAFKPNASALSVAMEYSATAVSNLGSFFVSLNESGTGKHNFLANNGGGGGLDVVTLSSAVALAPTVLIDYIDCAQLLSTAKHSVRVNGTAAGITSVIDATDIAGNFGNYDLFLGARSGGSVPSNMNLYRAFVLAGSSTAGEQLILENWLRESCGV